MVNRKQSLQLKKRRFFDHYLTLYDLSIKSNERVIEQLNRFVDPKKIIRKHCILSNIPDKYYDYNFDQIKNKILMTEKNVESVEILEKYLGSLENAAKKGIGLYISGPHGVAKTTLATIILKKAIKKYFRCFFFKSTEIVDFATSGWRNDDKKYFWTYVINTVDFLVIDDIARLFQVKQNEKIYVDEIFTKRDDFNLATIITANHDLESNKDLFGEALYSNFKERLIQVKIIGEDYRNVINKTLIDEL